MIRAIRVTLPSSSPIFFWKYALSSKSTKHSFSDGLSHPRDLYQPTRRLRVAFCRQPSILRPE
jgi:hypothetical protein